MLLVAKGTVVFGEGVVHRAHSGFPERAGASVPSHKAVRADPEQTE